VGLVPALTVTDGREEQPPRRLSLATDASEPAVRTEGAKVPR
jgi:hypothetical protein